MNAIDFDYIVGVDQTGAVTSTGKPKPLPVAILQRQKNNTWMLHCHLKKKPLTLVELSSNGINQLFLGFGFDFENSKTLVCADCVLGLPKEFFQKPGMSALEALKRHMNKTLDYPGYGLQTGSQFFTELLKTIGFQPDIYPHREVEIQANANSVFTHLPFQRNIQTGTFRIWKDLAKTNYHQLRIWPFENSNINRGEALLAEGYPSLAWKSLLGSHRSKQTLSHLKHIQKLQSVSIPMLEDLGCDHLDAVMLSLFCLKKLELGLSSSLNRASIEGAIFGFETLKEAKA